MSEGGRPSFEGEDTGGHAEVRIENLRVPAENTLGGRGNGFAMGQHRLGYGRLRHGKWAIAKAQAALDLAAKRALERVTFGNPVADRQIVQAQLAECATRLYLTRLMVLHIAYKMERGLDLTQENSMAKNYIAHMLHTVVDTALQIHGSLGYTHDTPLAHWYAEVRAQRLIDGPDEVHSWKVGKTVLAMFRRPEARRWRQVATSSDRLLKRPELQRLFRVRARDD